MFRVYTFTDISTTCRYTRSVEDRETARATEAEAGPAITREMPTGTDGEAGSTVTAPRTVAEAMEMARHTLSESLGEMKGPAMRQHCEVGLCHLVSPLKGAEEDVAALAWWIEENDDGDQGNSHNGHGVDTNGAVPTTQAVADHGRGGESMVPAPALAHTSQPPQSRVSSEAAGGLAECRL